MQRQYTRKGVGRPQALRMAADRPGGGVRVSHRMRRYYPGLRYDDIGFRCAAEVANP
jgi:hypothetical protein